MSSRLRVRFGEAQHGWLPVDIHTTEQKLAFAASHVPYDSLSELTVALLQAYLTETSYHARWMLEPTEYVFTFHRQHTQMQFAIFEHARPPLGKAQVTPLFAITDRPEVIVRPFWRALRSLETRSHFQEQWPWAFPHRDMRSLEAALLLS